MNGNNQGCTGDCSRCSSAQHSYCAVLTARKNQEILMGIVTLLAQPQQLITPMQGGEEDPAELKPKIKQQ
jgi:hypothetical protein